MQSEENYGDDPEMVSQEVYMDDMHEVKEALRTFILTNYLVGESPDQLKDDTPLLTSGVLDSLARIALVSFVEEQFGFEVEPHEAGVANFDTIEDMAGFVGRKRLVRS